MKPVTQTIIPGPDENRGNCFQACVASIFELPLEEVPDFCSIPRWEKWLETWLAERGFAYLEARLDTDEPAIYPIPKGVICVVSGHTDRHPTRLHSVVAGTAGNGVTWDFLHDPHPAGTFLTRATLLMVFLPLDPSKAGAQ